MELVQVQIAFRHGDRAPIWMPVSEEITNWMCEDEKDPNFQVTIDLYIF
jgi:hypothetical protein